MQIASNKTLKPTKMIITTAKGNRFDTDLPAKSPVLKVLNSKGHSVMDTLKLTGNMTTETEFMKPVSMIEVQWSFGITEINEDFIIQHYPHFSRSLKPRGSRRPALNNTTMKTIIHSELSVALDNNKTAFARLRPMGKITESPETWAIDEVESGNSYLYEREDDYEHDVLVLKESPEYLKATNQVTDKHEKRVYANRNAAFECLTNEDFISEAEPDGLVWSLDGFVEAFNSGEISDEWIIRII